MSELDYLSEPAVQYMADVPFTKTNSQTRFIDVVRSGLQGKHLSQIRKKTGLDLQQLATITQVTTRTLINKKSEDALGITVSEKLVSLVRLFLRGKELFGSDEQFKKWLNQPIPAFNNETPVSQLDTVFGFELVLDQLGRIEQGVFS